MARHAGSARAPGKFVRKLCLAVMSLVLLQAAPGLVCEASCGEQGAGDFRSAWIHRRVGTLVRVGSAPECTPRRSCGAAQDNCLTAGPLTCRTNSSWFRRGPWEQHLTGSSASLKSAADAVKELSTRVGMMLQDSRDMAVASVPSYRGTRTKLDEILKRREFRSAGESAEAESLWDRIVDRLWGSLDKLFKRTGSHPRARGLLLWGIVIGTGVIFLGWLIQTLTNISSPPRCLSPR